MSSGFDRWLTFLHVDGETIATLKEFSWLVDGEIDAVVDKVYERAAANPATLALFDGPEGMARARDMQRRHWREHVFAGNFNEEYVHRSRIIGQTHHRVGVDLMMYMGAYSVVHEEMAARITRRLADRPDDLRRLLAAVGRVIYLDMGLATSVYYDSVMVALEEMSHELNLSLARAGEFRDNETGNHILRMSRMCHALARAAGMDEKWAKMLQVASPLHDVGKIGIPDAILLKPGRLNVDELEIMRSHPTIGGQIIPEHPAEVIRMAKRVSLTHHEKWDGTGYPAGLKGEEIPLEGRIAAICDVYDALLSTRPYKQAWSQEEAVAHLRANRGTHFDPALVDAFLSILPEVEAIRARFSCEGLATDQ